jgi:hypothetical protein
MKITGLDVPPELATAFAQHVTMAVAGDQSPTIARTAQATGKPTPRRKNKGAATDADRIIAMLADAYGFNADTPGDAAWRADRKAELRAGTFNPDYWKPATLLAEQRLTVGATGEEQLPRPAYNYQRADNRPTVTTWGAPAPSAAEIGYHGAVFDNLFLDDTLTYHVAEYRLPARSAAAGETQAVAIIAGTISATADRRGSKAMFSLIARFEQLNDPTPDLSEAPPPIAPSTSHYWPFAPPLGVAPYYAASLNRIVSQLPTRTNETATGSIARLTFTTRPLFGHANNNNNEVTTTFEGTASVYVIPRPPLSRTILVAAESGQQHPQLYTFRPTSQDAAPWRRDFAFNPMPAKCADGYVVRNTDGTYSMRDLRFAQLFDFETVRDYTNTPVQPFPTPTGWHAYYVTTTPAPTQWHHVTWNLSGAVTSTTDVGMEYATDYYDYRHQQHTPANNIIEFDGIDWKVSNWNDERIATLSGVAEGVYQIDIQAYGENYWWFIGPDADDMHHVYVIPAPPDDYTAPAEPPTIHATQIAFGEFWNPNAAMLGDNLYIETENDGPHAWAPNGTELPFAGVPPGTWLTDFHPTS